MIGLLSLKPFALARGAALLAGAFTAQAQIALAQIAPARIALAQNVPLSSLTLNGSAAYGSNVVQLTNTYSQASSAFVPTPYALGPAAQFEIFFAYHAYGGGQDPADGLALVVQNSGAGAHYLGLSGSGLGFFTLSPGAAIAATFDYYVNGYTGSSAGALSIATPDGIDLATAYPSPAVFGGAGSAGVRYVWVTYANASNLLSVYLSNTGVKPPTPVLTANPPQDLSSAFGGQFYVGVTAGTGALSSVQRVESLAVSVIGN